MHGIIKEKTLCNQSMLTLTVIISNMFSPFWKKKNLKESWFYSPRPWNINIRTAVTKDGREVEMGNIYTKWQKNLDQERGQIWTLYLSLLILRKKFFHGSYQLLLVNTFSLSAHTQRYVHLEAFCIKSTIFWHFMFFSCLMVLKL